MRELFTIAGHASGYRATCSAYSREEADAQRARMVADHAARGIYFATVEVHRTTIKTRDDLCTVCGENPVTLDGHNGLCSVCLYTFEPDAHTPINDTLAASADAIARTERLVDRHHLATPVYRRDWTDPRGPTVPQGL